MAENELNPSFWKTVKPFLTNKGYQSTNSITLNESGDLITDPVKVAETMNTFFVTVADNIGTNLEQEDLTNHPSILSIKNQQLGKPQTFEFGHITTGQIEKIISNLNSKKATGPDQIPLKLLKMSKTLITPILTSMINDDIGKGTFPDILKDADVSPVYKKGDQQAKQNYRPVSILNANF